MNRGLQTAACKCGPDYIDPMFHSRIIGAKSANLDLHFFSENTLRYLFAKNAADRDVSIIEGVMGYYDGLGLTSTKASSYEVAQVTDSPVVLVVNAKGASLSVLAVIQGFLNFAPKSNIRGVLLNQCSPMAYTALSKAIEDRLGVACYGYLPKMEDRFCFSDLGSERIPIIQNCAKGCAGRYAQNYAHLWSALKIEF